MDLIDREQVIKSLFNFTDGTKTIGQCIDDVQTVEAIPLNVIKEIKTEIKNSSCGSWYVENPDKTLEKVVLLRMVDVLGIIDKKVKEYSE